MTTISRTDKSASTLLATVWQHLFAPVDIASLAFFRIAFGAIMLWEMWRYFSKGWISRYYIEPTFHFTYYGFDWVRPWQGDGMYWHFALLAVLALCILIGFCYRIATLLFFLGFFYIFLLDQTQHLNHFYLICLISFLLIFVPAHRAFSVDARIRPSLAVAAIVPAWALWILRFQIGLVYFYGGVAKLNADWLRGEPMRLWLAESTSTPLIGPYLTREEVVWLFSYSGLLIDLLAAPMLLRRPTRIPAVVLLASFHLLNNQLFSIGIFPWFMLAATTLFFDPAWPRQFLPERWKPATNDTPLLAEQPFSQKQNGTLALLGLYALWQILMPLRHFLYPGKVSWTEEGHRFAWHMKLRSKRGEAIFTVTDPQSGRKWRVDNLEYLTERQSKKMSTRPDMIVQFAHHLAEDFRRRGYENVQVQAEAMISLNGRRPQLMVDPSIDLAAQLRTLSHVSWIMPLYEMLPTPPEINP